MPNMDWSKFENIFCVFVSIFAIFRTVKSMERAAPHLNNIQELLKNAIFLQQQLKYEQSRKTKRDSSSLYQRFSAHLGSVDLPDLGDIRVDSVIAGPGPRERSSTGPSSGGGV